jgi:hypothetical protein
MKHLTSHRTWLLIVGIALPGSVLWLFPWERPGEAEYRRIQVGMTSGEVEEILGHRTEWYSAVVGVVPTSPPLDPSASLVEASGCSPEEVETLDQQQGGTASNNFPLSVWREYWQRERYAIEVDISYDYKGEDRGRYRVIRTCLWQMPQPGPLEMFHRWGWVGRSR